MLNNPPYNLADKPSKDELKELGTTTATARHVKAVLTGEYRTPRKGEWFISGAIPEAYRAVSANMSSAVKFHIARLVVVTPAQ